MPKTKLNIGVLADPLESFDPHNESTSFLIQEFNRRHWPVWHFELKDLFLKNGVPHGHLKQVQVKKNKSGFSYSVLKRKTANLNQMQALFLRKDPPFDLKFLDHLSLLELVDTKKTRLLNHPTWIKHANEKIFPFHFKDISPRSLISLSNQDLRAFVQKEKTAILKPLNMAGGRDIVKVEAKNPSLNSLLDLLTHGQSRYILAQQYLPEAQKGDKRILLWDGEILGSFLRVPGKKDFRGNLHSGAKLKKTKLTSRDKELVQTIAPQLKKLGLTFVGLDVIGTYVTEINCTSPMGIGEINQLTASQIEKKIANWLFETLS